MLDIHGHATSLGLSPPRSFATTRDTTRLDYVEMKALGSFILRGSPTKTC